MNIIRSSTRFWAFTLVEMLTVIGIISILAALLMPTLGEAKAHAKRIVCMNDLRQMGIGEHIFANDHNGKLPTSVSIGDGGAQEYVAQAYQYSDRFYSSYQFVLPLAGELHTPRLVVCPADLERDAATNFVSLNNWNLSYDIGLAADLLDPGTVLAADRGFPCWAYSNSVTLLSINPQLNTYAHFRWPRNLHMEKGNVLFTDGHVEQSSDLQVGSEETVPENLAYPTVQGPPPGSVPVAVNPYGSYVGAKPHPTLEAIPPLTPPVLAQAAHESIAATRWLLWLMLLFLLLVLFAHWLDRRLRNKRARPSKPELELE